MAEYKLSYTAAEIDERLGKVGILSSDVEQIEADIEQVEVDIEQIEAGIDNINNIINNKADENHLHDEMTGATPDVNGSSGFVPAPSIGDGEKFLKGDGTWAEVPSSVSVIMREW